MGISKIPFGRCSGVSIQLYGIDSWDVCLITSVLVVARSGQLGGVIFDLSPPQKREREGEGKKKEEGKDTNKKPQRLCTGRYLSACLSIWTHLASGHDNDT